MNIVQIAPFISFGTGQAGVAWYLEQEFRKRGIEVESFTLATARQGRIGPWLHGRLPERVIRAWQLVWFSTVGTLRARRFLADRPGAITICHDGPMIGDIYVSHGILGAPADAAGRNLWRRLQHPSLLFVNLRDRVRFRGRCHRAVVAPSREEARALVRMYGRMHPPLTIIPNGVDLERFHPPDAEERQHARNTFRLNGDDRVALFIGHDVVRKGLIHAVRALTSAPSILLLVVGGNLEGIESARAEARALGVEARVLFVGTRSDLPLFFAASDMFVFPSSYEANALVILEALASGLPVVTTPVGFAPELVVDDENGFLVDTNPQEIGARLETLASQDIGQWRARARASVIAYSWQATADRYLALMEALP